MSPRSISIGYVTALQPTLPRSFFSTSWNLVDVAASMRLAALAMASFRALTTRAFFSSNWSRTCRVSQHFSACNSGSSERESNIGGELKA